jgi:hypothetical protein
VVVPGSHRQFEALAREFGDSPIPLSHPIFERAIQAHLEAGDMFWWDSRTLHGNSAGAVVEVAEDAHASGGVPGLLRAAVYVCMAPRARASAATLAQRKRAVAAGVGGGAFCVHPMAAFEAAHQITDVEQVLVDACAAAGGEYRRAPNHGEGWELSAEQMALV